VLARGRREPSAQIGSASRHGLGGGGIVDGARAASPQRNAVTTGLPRDARRLAQLTLRDPKCQ
jgi:hypothetical protein